MIDWVEMLRQYDEGVHTRAQVAETIEVLIMAAGQNTNQAYVINLEHLVSVLQQVLPASAIVSREAHQMWLLQEALRANNIEYVVKPLKVVLPSIAADMVGADDEPVIIVGDRSAKSDDGWGWDGVYISTLKEAGFDDLVGLLEIYVWLKDGAKESK